MVLLERDTYLAELERLLWRRRPGTGAWSSSEARRAWARPRSSAGSPTPRARRRGCSSAPAIPCRRPARCLRFSTSPPRWAGRSSGSWATRAARHRILRGILAELSGGLRPTLAVFEDAHWADEATLDLLRFVGRRCGSTRLLLIVTYRDDEVGPTHPLRVVLGDLATTRPVRRLSLPCLTEAAVRRLAEGGHLDPAELYRRTAGNPFFATEALASGWDAIPATVRDAVLARASRLTKAGRATLDAAAVIGAHGEAWLLAEVAGRDAPAVRDCVSPEVSASTARASRSATSSSPATRSSSRCPRRGSWRFTGARWRPSDPHADDPGHPGPPGAPRRGRRRRAGRARVRDGRGPAGLDPPCASSGPSAVRAGPPFRGHPRAGRASRPPRGLRLRVPSHRGGRRRDRRTAGRRFASGGSAATISGSGMPLGGSRGSFWYAGRNAEARQRRRAPWTSSRRSRPGPSSPWPTARRRSFECLPAMPTPRSAGARRRSTGRPPRRSRDARPCAQQSRQRAPGRRRRRRLAGARPQHPHRRRRRSRGPRRAGVHEPRLRPRRGLRVHARRSVLSEGIAYCTERDLDHLRAYMTAWHALCRFFQGRWAEAAELAPPGFSVRPIWRRRRASWRVVALARVRVRRGDPEAEPLLDEALALARRTDALQAWSPSMWPGRGGVARGGPGSRGGGSRRHLCPRHRQQVSLARGALAYWRWRTGHLPSAPPWIGSAFTLQIAGRWREPGGVGDAGCPYEPPRAAPPATTPTRSASPWRTSSDWGPARRRRA